MRQVAHTIGNHVQNASAVRSRIKIFHLTHAFLDTRYSLKLKPSHAFFVIIASSTIKTSLTLRRFRDREMCGQRICLSEVGCSNCGTFEIHFEMKSTQRSAKVNQVQPLVTISAALST